MRPKGQVWVMSSSRNGEGAEVRTTLCRVMRFAHFQALAFLEGIALSHETILKTGRPLTWNSIFNGFFASPWYAT